MNGEWDTITRSRELEPERIRPNAYEDNAPLFFDEEYFQNMLAIERRRAERTGKHFLLVLVALRVPLKKSSTTTALEKINLHLGEDYNVLTFSFDETDTPEKAVQFRKSLGEKVTMPQGADKWVFAPDTKGEQSTFKMWEDCMHH